MFKGDKTVSEEIVYLLMLLRKARIAIELLTETNNTDSPTLNGLLSEIKEATKL